MLKMIASRKLSIALEKMEAPMKLINMQSILCQDIINVIQDGHMSAEDGAKLILNSVYNAIEQHNPHNTHHLR